MFALGHDAVGFADVNADEFGFDASDHAGHDSADFVFEDGENDVAFGLAETLDDDLLGSLGGNAAEAGDFVFFFDNVADFFAFAGFFDGDFVRGIVGDVVFDDSTHDESVGFAGVEIEFGTDVHVFVAVVFAPGGGDGLLDNVENGFFGQVFFFSDDVDHAGKLFEIN